MLVHNIPYVGFMRVKVVVVCLLPFNGIGSIVPHHYILHVKGAEKAVDGLCGAFSWKFEGSLDRLVVETFNLLELEGLCVHETVLALPIVDECSISEVGDDIRHPAVDDVPLRALAPLHDV